MKIKIQDMANIVNCTPETLRFYEKENVLLPKRETKNNYRYYDIQNLKILSKCIFLRSLHFSIKDITKIISDGTVDNVDKILLKKEAELINESDRLLATIKALTDYREKIEKISTYFNKFSEVEIPEMLLFINQHNDSIYKGVDIQKETAKLFKNFPFINTSIMVKKDDVVNDKVWSRYLGYSVNVSSRCYRYFKDDPLMKKIPPRKCLYTIQSFHLTNDSKIAVIKSLRDFINNNNYIVNGDMIGNQLFVDNEKYLDRKKPEGLIYYEYWIPIE
ncbi:helix-turn-helix domain-containing protein [Shewanella sp. A14]